MAYDVSSTNMDMMGRHAEIAAIRLYIARQVQIPRLLAGSFYPILCINCRDEPSLDQKIIKHVCSH